MLLSRRLFASPTSCKEKGKKKRAGVSKLDSELARPAITDLTTYSQVAAVNSFNEYKSGSKTNISSGCLQSLQGQVLTICVLIGESMQFFIFSSRVRIEPQNFIDVHMILNCDWWILQTVYACD